MTINISIRNKLIEYSFNYEKKTNNYFRNSLRPYKIFVKNNNIDEYLNHFFKILSEYSLSKYIDKSVNLSFPLSWCVQSRYQNDNFVENQKFIKKIRQRENKSKHKILYFLNKEYKRNKIYSVDTISLNKFILEKFLYQIDLLNLRKNIISINVFNDILELENVFFDEFFKNKNLSIIHVSVKSDNIFISNYNYNGLGEFKRLNYGFDLFAKIIARNNNLQNFRLDQIKDYLLLENLPFKIHNNIEDISKTYFQKICLQINEIMNKKTHKENFAICFEGKINKVPHYKNLLLEYANLNERQKIYLLKDKEKKIVKNINEKEFKSQKDWPKLNYA